jgi:hypothetical protein
MEERSFSFLLIQKWLFNAGHNRSIFPILSGVCQERGWGKSAMGGRQ